MDASYDPQRAKETNTAWLLGVMGTFCFLAITAISARAYTRFKFAKTAGWDDYLMIASGVATLGGMICFAIQARYGLGKHREFISDDDHRTFSKIGFLQGLISDTGAIALLKISIALSLLRLSADGKRWYSILLWGLIVFVIAYVIVAWCSCIFYCKPISGFWDKRNNPKCYDIELFIMFALLNTACNLVTDLAFATLPIPLIWVLQMKLRVRLYSIGILSLGYTAVAMGAVKAFYQIQFGGSKDDQFLRPIHFWGFLELSVGIIAACIPTLRPLVAPMLKVSVTDGDSKKKEHGANTHPHGNYARNSLRYAWKGAPAGAFELDETPNHGHKGLQRGDIRANRELNSTAVKKRNSETGSEEMILQDSRDIMRETEMEVER